MSLEKRVSWAEETEDGKAQSHVSIGGSARSPLCLEHRWREGVRG